MYMGSNGENWLPTINLWVWVPWGIPGNCFIMYNNQILGYINITMRKTRLKSSNTKKCNSGFSKMLHFHQQQLFSVKAN